MGIYIISITTGSSMGKPQRWLPSSFSNISSGFPESGRIKNIKFVSQSRFKPYTGMASATSKIILLNAALSDVSTCPAVTSSNGYITIKI